MSAPIRLQGVLQPARLAERIAEIRPYLWICRLELYRTLERAYARYDLRDVARALWETIDLWQGVEEETARRLGVDTRLDHAELRRRIAEVVPDPRR